MDHIVGVLFFQLAFHLEPLVIEQPYVNFLRLQSVIEEAAFAGNGKVPYYCFTDGNEKMNRICELGGMKRVGDFWAKE